MAWASILGGILGNSGSSSGGGGGGGGLIADPILGSVANLVGGFLGQAPQSPGSQIIPYTDPRFDPALQAAQFDALNQIGFGNINNIPSPVDQLINRIHALPMEDRYKRRAIRGINEYLAGKPIARGHALKMILPHLGLTKSDLKGIKSQQEQYESQIEKLSGLGGMNTDTILNRANVANQASKLLASAGSFATGGAPSELQTLIRNSLSRNLDDQEKELLLKAQFSGINPGAALKDITDQRTDLDLKAIEQSLFAASGLTSGLNAGLTGSLNAGNSSAGATANALGIASQQAQAANALRQQIEQNNTDALANGVSGAIAALGKGASNYSVYKGLFGSGSSAPASESWGPGSTNQQLATQSARYDGWNPSVSFGGGS